MHVFEEVFSPLFTLRENLTGKKEQPKDNTSIFVKQLREIEKARKLKNKFIPTNQDPNHASQPPLML
jgi:hypothetical protein